MLFNVCVISVTMFFYFAPVFLQTLLCPAEVRPIWNIAHMVNSLEEIDHYLNKGANALEADFSFDELGTPNWTYHGSPCDCFRNCEQHEEVDQYLRRVRELTSPDNPDFDSKFVLLLIDLKISELSQGAKYMAGLDLASRIIKHLWEGPQAKSVVWVLLSFPYTDDTPFVTGFLQMLGDKGFQAKEMEIGWDISGNEDLNVIKETYITRGVPSGVWQSDGITNCLPRGTGRLSDAINKRDRDPEWAFLDKVYSWTLDYGKTMRKHLRLGVDAIITNHPDNFRKVLKEKEFSGSHRLATIKDNPWRKVIGSKRRTARRTQATDKILKCNLE